MEPVFSCALTLPCVSISRRPPQPCNTCNKSKVFTKEDKDVDLVSTGTGRCMHDNFYTKRFQIDTIKRRKEKKVPAIHM